MGPCCAILSFVVMLLSPPSATAAPPRPQPAATFPPHGGAYVTSLPESASAWLDGTYIGTTPAYVDDLLPGRHAVTLSRSGWQPQTMQFDVSAGHITPVSAIMERVAPQPGGQRNNAQGTLAIVGGPAGAKVYVDGNAIGSIPVDPRTLDTGYHIVTLEPPVKNATRSTRIVDVFPGTTTVVAFAEPSSTAIVPAPDDILEPVETIVPAGSVVIAGNDVTIHYRGVEIQCAIGSRSYTYNGKAGTFTVSPALVGGKVYLPLSLLQRLAGNGK